MKKKILFQKKHLSLVDFFDELHKILFQHLIMENLSKPNNSKCFVNYKKFIVNLFFKIYHFFLLKVNILVDRIYRIFIFAIKIKFYQNFKNIIYICGINLILVLFIMLA